MHKYRGKADRERGRSVMQFLVQLIKYRAIYDDSMPGASLGWHTPDMEMTFDMLALRSTLMMRYRHLIMLHHPASPISVESMSAVATPVMEYWNARHAAPTDATDSHDDSTADLERNQKMNHNQLTA